MKVLCLHGSRQDAVIFKSRIKALSKKLSPAGLELIFASAPHELPLVEGQDDVRMRTWWHSWALEAQENKQPDSDVDWDARIVADWQASLTSLQCVWQEHGGFDAILGFSNGAAASFLLAAHVLAHPHDFPGRRLRCVICAGGYLPQPLDALLPTDSEVTRTQEVLSRGDEGGPLRSSPRELATPLRLPSLHIMSPTDKCVGLEQSKQLAAQFDASRGQKLEHDLGHCVPQKAQHVGVILDFLSWFLPEEPTPAAPVELFPPELPPVAAPQPVEVPLQPEEPADTQGQNEEQHYAEPMPEQQEEIEALQAIFDRCFSLVPHPSLVRVRVRLRDPLTLDAHPDSDGSDEENEAQGPPSSLFALECTLPESYPSTSAAAPVLHVSGPPLEPAHRDELLSHLDGVARETMEEFGQGCVYQVVEAATQWLDAHLPPDFVSSYVARNNPSMKSQQAPDDDNEQQKQPPWWLEEEADAELVRAAIAEASASNRWAQTHALGSSDAGPAGTSGTGDVSMAQAADHTQRGRCDFIVGLVGKPSAGKSSFYNAVTQPIEEDGDGARVAAFPFTTIDPQTGRGFALVPDVCELLGPEIASKCKPLHGYASAFAPENAPSEFNNISPLHCWADAAMGRSASSTPQPANAAQEQGAGEGEAARVRWRKVNCAIKDVAGLVPGAYQGKGRGNAFLNDLCQASVLVHVVDASGCTDKEGRLVKNGGGASEGMPQEEGGDPLADIGWVREEIHRWVFNNVRTKWASVRRRPCKLCDLFGGYHASQPLVYEVLERVGLSVPALTLNGGTPEATATLCAWGEADLHRLVATFLAARFPILLALNKCDTPSAARHIRRIREEYPGEPAVAMSTASERWLSSSRQQGLLEYEDASASVSLAPGCEDEGVSRQLNELRKRVLTPFGGTGVLLAVSTAMAMRPPSILFPVGDLAACVALPARSHMGGEDAKARCKEGNSPSVLRDAVLLKPGSTPADLFSVLSKPPYLLLDGEYVRTEARVLHQGSTHSTAKTSSASRAVLKKDDVLGWSTCVCRIMCNRKGGGWQKH